MADPPPPLSTTPPPSSAASSAHTSFNADPPPPKLRLMCSYNGHIIPRPHDKSLCYVGGDTRIIVADRRTSLADLRRRLSRTLLDSQPFSLKYQLPSEDLDSLITVTSDEDFENMVEEYDRLSAKSGRLRLFLFPTHSSENSNSNIEQFLAANSTNNPSSVKSDDWFFDALNGKSGNFSAAASDRELSETSSVNCLLGLDDDDRVRSKSAVIMEKGNAIEVTQLDSPKNVVGTGSATVNDGNYGGNPQEVQYAGPDFETTSSFGSASSSPSVANLPRGVGGAEESHQRMGIEEQFQQMSVAGNANFPARQEEMGGFTAAVPGLPLVVGGGEYGNRVFSDDERSDHGGYRKVQHVQQQVQAVQLQQQQKIPPQFQQRQTGGYDLPSPDSVSSEGSVTNPLTRERQAAYQEQLTRIHSANARIISSNQADQATYQEQLMRIHSANARLISSNQTDPISGNQINSNAQMQPQVQESNYVVSGQYEQTHPHLQQSQQFVHTGNNQYIPANAVPITSYYPMYPPTQQHHPKQPGLDQQYPVYIINGTQQPQAYGLSMPPTNPNHPQTPYNQKPEMAGGVYRTTAPQFVQGQYVGFNQIHHPSSTVNSNYTYETAGQTHAQMYYTSPQHQLAAQYQASSASGMAVTDASAQISREASLT